MFIASATDLCRRRILKRVRDGEFRQRPPRRRARRYRRRRAPAAPCRRAATAERPAAQLADLGRARRGSRVRRSRRQLPVVTSVCGRRTGSRRPSCGGEHRDRVGQITGLSTSRPQCIGDRSQARVLYLSPTKALGHDQLRAAHALTGAIPRLHASHPLPTTATVPPRSAALRANAPDGCFPTPTWSICRSCATMPAGPSCCEAFDSSSSTNAITTEVFSAPTWRWCCAACCGCARDIRLDPIQDGDLRQRDDRFAGRDGH